MKYRLNNGYELENVDDLNNNIEDLLLIDNNLNRIIVLNYSCAYIINELKNEKDKEELISHLEAKFSVDRAIIEKDVIEIVEALLKENILCEV